MDERFNALAKRLLNKSLDECSEDEIRSVADRYPYFAPAQFLLLKKLPPDSEAYRRQYQHAILFYHNPAAFDLVMNSDSYVDLVFDETPPVEIAINEEQVIEEETIEKPDIIPVDLGHEEVKYEETRQEEKIEEKTTQVEPENIPELPKFEAAKPEETKEESSVLAFEPYHTVDYFASQGIKLMNEEPKDALGKQLKSFTEWLKTMKKLPAADLTKNLDGPSDHKVERLAEHSIESTEVLTEAMAEVWIRQGNKQKAKEVYNKLSLQNPSKRAYFAAKIEHLNSEN